MVDPSFLNKLLRTPNDAGSSTYDFVRPSDLDVPQSAMGDTFATILGVPLHIGSVVRDVYLFGVEQARRRSKDEWTAMPYTQRDTTLEEYLRKTGWFDGPVTIVDPPCPGLYVCLTTKGLEALVESFPSNSYRKRKEVTT